MQGGSRMPLRGERDPEEHESSVISGQTNAIACGFSPWSASEAGNVERGGPVCATVRCPVSDLTASQNLPS